ncbi:MAG: RNA polymerase sigma factor [Limisphaerales bacterium]
MAAVPEHERLPVNEAKAGDGEAWATLFQRYRLPLFTYIMQMVRHEQTAFDIVQETMLSAVKHIASLQSDAKFGSWLFGIAHQKCIQQWRKTNREDVALKQIETEPTDLQDDPGDVLIADEDRAHFFKILNKLPDAQRSALVLHFLEDFSLEEIATITGTSVGTVKSRLHYGKKALKELLQESAQ